MADHHIPIPGQRPTDHTPAPPRPTLRQWWDDAWTEGGTLHTRWEELRQAPDLGWHQMAHWIKAALAVTGACLAVVLFHAAVTVLVDAVQHLVAAAQRFNTQAPAGALAVIDQPVRAWIIQHAAHLPVPAAALYALWQFLGLFGFAGGFLRSSGARLTWCAWGAATTAMVHDATAPDSRTIAAGLTVLAWTVLSTLALRGLTLTPTVRVYAPAPEIRPHIHLPAPAEGSYGTPLQNRTVSAGPNTGTQAPQPKATTNEDLVVEAIGQILTAGRSPLEGVPPKEILEATGLSRPSLETVLARSQHIVRLERGRYSLRKSQSTETVAIDMDVARRAGEAVNRGDVDEANRIVNTTAHPREHAFAAFRFIRNDED